MTLRKTLLGAVCLLGITLTAHAEEPTKLLWGDTHLHTRNSFDAFLNNNVTADPDMAYRWAKGLPVIHPYHRKWVRIDRPLDFLVVSDHAEYMGLMPAAYEGKEFPKVGFIDSLKRWYVLRTLVNAVKEKRGVEAFAKLLPDQTGETRTPAQLAGVPAIANPFGDADHMEQETWNDTAEAADRHYEPGKFTALIGWEWSSMPGGANLHRIVMSSTTGENAKNFLPYGSDQSQYPEDLWAWLEKTSADTGAEFMAIPHNSNISKGYMFAETTLHGEKITADYARLRMKWEPVVEITQIKGDSETWPGLSPDDEFADFEPFTRYLQQLPEDYVGHKGDFIRSALKRGMEIENDIGVNPYKFGVIGSTDAHTSIASADEDNFHGKLATDSIPENKGPNGLDSLTGWDMSASGYAGVWAKENTREEILAAFKRREVYATTGPRIALRVFGGYSFETDDAKSPALVTKGYEEGVPMGGDLLADGARPVRLLIRAVKDPVGANLDRVQVIKAWLDADGQSHEKVFNVIWSDGRPQAENGSVPPVGNSVDLATARTENNIGAEELATVWQDPEFNPAQKSFYYVRVLQIPTARHSLYDTLALNEKHDEERAGPATIQERAYSSPIWFTP